MFESLTEKLESIFKKLKGKGLLKEEDVELALKEIRLALLEADVNFRVVKDFVRKIREKAIGKEVLESLTPGQQVIKIVNEELCALLGQTNSRIQLSPNPPTVIMMVGLHGSGKTTTAAKLARLFKKEGRRPLLVAADLQRPAAIDQLVTLGTQIEVPVYHSKEAKDPVRLSADSVKKARLDAQDVVIVDAVNIAGNFGEQIGIDGIILTKMDGDARGGAALSIISVTGKPIKFIGTGEKIEMLEPFYPDRIASRILGMGDVLSLIEQAQETFDQKEAQKLQKAIMDEAFTFDDLRDQLRKMRSMGPLENILNMIPGAGKIKDLKVDERELVKVEAIISSMTKKERKDHNLINGSRRKRIATGSGTTVADVNRVVKQYVEIKRMLKMFKGKKGFKLPKFMPF